MNVNHKAIEAKEVYFSYPMALPLKELTFLFLRASSSVFSAVTAR